MLGSRLWCPIAKIHELLQDSPCPVTIILLSIDLTIQILLNQARLSRRQFLQGGYGIYNGQWIARFVPTAQLIVQLHLVLRSGDTSEQQ